MLSTAARRLDQPVGGGPGERAVVFTANATATRPSPTSNDAGVEVVRVVDARRGERRRAGRGAARRRGRRAGRRGPVECDLLVTATGWTAPTSLLNMAGDRPVYDPEAARFVPGDRLPATVLAAGGLAGDGTIDELLAHADAVGTAAAGRGRPGQRPPPAPGRPASGRRTRRCSGRPRTASSTSPRTCRPRISWPRPGGLRLGRAAQAVHHRHHGLGPGQARDGQRRGRPGRGHRPHHRRDRHHGLAPALRPDHAGGPGRPAARAGALLAHAALARSARRRAAGGRPVDPARPLRRPVAEVRNVRPAVGDHRRDAARQARPAGPRRPQAPQPGLRQQVVEAGRGRASATA